jgi:NAD(P)-dependent dehydrogenase (short-subunit alcohol dehydrogenase family)
MGRPAKTEEIANLVAFLISDESSYINGQSVVIDGGLNKSF